MANSVCHYLMFLASKTKVEFFMASDKSIITLVQASYYISMFFLGCILSLYLLCAQTFSICFLSTCCITKVHD